jgi:hypothetical protein
MMETSMAAKRLGPREKAFYFRPREEDRAYIYQLMLETGQTMLGVFEHMIKFCRGAEGFTVPPRISKTLLRSLETKKRRTSRYRKLARVK